MSGYALALGLALVPAGRLGDTLGRRRMFLIALSAVAGLGGGLVTSPNVTLTLESVPVRMAGAAGGALQTAQRIGAAIGTAVLATIYFQMLAHTGRDYSTAVSDTLLCASVLMVLALLMAVAEVMRRRSHRPSQPAPTPRPEHDLHRV